MNIEEILETCRTIAVVGLSSNPSRSSFGVSEYMQAKGYKIIPVNPNELEVLGETACGRLEDLAGSVDIMNVFRQSKYVSDIIDSAIHIRAKVVWLQEGVVDEMAARRARDAGLVVVMNRCILKEHKKRF